MQTWFQKHRFTCRSGDKDWSQALNLMFRKRGTVNPTGSIVSPPMSPRANRLPDDQYTQPDTAKLLTGKVGTTSAYIYKYIYMCVCEP